jgi:hypothetical protein
MELHIADERAFLLTEQFTPEQAREKAIAAKMTVFGMLNNLLFRPKENDVQITRTERRYEPIWHIVCHSEVEYDIRSTFTLTVPNKYGAAVVLDAIPDQTFTPEKGQIALTGTTQCHEDHKREVIYDAVTGIEQPTWEKFLVYPKEEIANLAAFRPEGVIVVPPETRASALVRQQLAGMMQAVQADNVHKEIVEIQTVDLYFHPVFVYEYHWVSKDRRQTVQIDGLSGELSTAQKAIGSIMGKSITPELLFDVGADAVDLLIPGGGIAMKVGRALTRKQSQG